MRAGVALLLIAVAGCSGRDRTEPVDTDAVRLGKIAIERFDCGVCHQIPGIRGARGQAGPSLDRYGGRVYVAGKFPNTSEHLIRWLRHPATLTPHTAMPDLGIDETQAHNIAAYLHALR